MLALASQLEPTTFINTLFWFFSLPAVFVKCSLKDSLRFKVTQDRLGGTGHPDKLTVRGWRWYYADGTQCWLFWGTWQNDWRRQGSESRTDVRIRIQSNPEVCIKLPYHFWLAFSPWQRFALSKHSLVINKMLLYFWCDMNIKHKSKYKNINRC